VKKKTILPKGEELEVGEATISFYCSCLMHGFNLLALLQQHLLLSNSGQLKQVVPFCFSMISYRP
jgi:hypothetical protein